MLIVIPMAGLSQRFTAAGYTAPKYMLEAGGLSLFRHAVQSFVSLFETAHFLFIHRDVHNTGAFIECECATMDLHNFTRYVLDAPTRGQAETVAIGLRQSGCVGNGDPILIFNIDTIRPGYEPPAFIDQVDGYLEVFRGEGDGWSFIGPAPGPGQKVAHTTEKKRISDLCSDGLYYFRDSDDFLAAYDAELASGPSYANEYYVAPLYNQLIQRGLDIRFDIIEPGDVIFSGVPAEYEAFRALIEKRHDEK